MPSSEWLVGIRPWHWWRGGHGLGTSIVTAEEQAWSATIPCPWVVACDPPWWSTAAVSALALARLDKQH